MKNAKEKSEFDVICLTGCPNNSVLYFSGIANDYQHFSETIFQ